MAAPPHTKQRLTQTRAALCMRRESLGLAGWTLAQGAAAAQQISRDVSAAEAGSLMSSSVR